MADFDAFDRSRQNTGDTPKRDQIAGTDLAGQEQADQATQASLIQRAGREPGSLSAADVKQLQRAIGNQAVSQLLEAGQPIQAAGEISEEEEEPVQGRFMTVQRVEEIPQEEEEEPLQAKKAGAFNTESVNATVLPNSDPAANIGAPAYMHAMNVPGNFFTRESPSSSPVVQKIGLSQHFWDVHYAPDARRARKRTKDAGRKKNTVVKNNAANNIIIANTKAHGDNFTFVNVAYWSVNNDVAAHGVGNIIGNTDNNGDAHHIA